MNTDVIIIGGGLMASSTALQLALRGVKCTVLDKDHPGRHASGVNAGGLRQLNRHPAEIPLSVAAAKMWHNITDLVDSNCDARFPGQIRVAENADDLQKLQQRADMTASLGYQHEQMISRSELYDMVPALAPHCVGGLICRDDGYARPYHALSAFRLKAQSLGVTYHNQTEVTALKKDTNSWELKTSNGLYQAPIIVNCAGAWANNFASVLGEQVPLSAKAPMMMVTERLKHFIDPVIGAASRKLSFKQMQNGTLLIGGAHLAKLDFARQQTDMDWLKLAESAQTVMALFPQLHDVLILRTWAGIEAFMPDNLPVISASSKAENVFHAFGFSAHGFQLAPLVGLIMAQLILDGKSEFPIEPFDIKRFLSS